MSTLLDSIIANMLADGQDTRTVLAYKESFRQAVICIDDQRLLYSYKEQVEVITKIHIHVQ